MREYIDQDFQKTVDAHLIESKQIIFDYGKYKCIMKS